MKTAAKEAQAKVNNMLIGYEKGQNLYRLLQGYTCWNDFVMNFSKESTGTLLERVKKTQRYPEARVIVLNDEVNTFEHVVTSLNKIIPGMTEKRAWDLAHKIDRDGSAEVWCGPLEQAELYHQQLVNEGLTMAPIERT